MPSQFHQINQYLKEVGEPDYRLTQIMEYLLQQQTDDFQQMTNLPQDLRKKLTEKFFPLQKLTVKKQQKAPQVEKILFQTTDQLEIETVLMHYQGEKTPRTSLCLSVSSGCPIGCPFCATGSMGFQRHLTTDEIISQILYFLLQGKNIQTFSFMGMGEPLLNPQIFSVLDILTDKKLFALGQRRLNLSTVGLLPEMNTLTHRFSHLNLALSLHSPFQEQREKLIPLAQKNSLEELFDSLNRSIDQNREKIFLAYLLLDGVNDSYNHAQKLSKLIHRQGKFRSYYHVNLIAFNPWTGSCFNGSPPEKIRWFQNILEKRKIQVTLRHSFGEQIDAACGQLKKRN